MLTDKTIVLGITGSIAAYKAAELASRLTKAGAKVETVMTEAAQRFIVPLTLQSLTHRPVACDMWTPLENFSITHVSLAQAADVAVIAPATANIIAKMAYGLADDLLSSIVLATKAPVIVAPAMNNNMYESSVTQENIARLRARGFVIVEPEIGHLACNAIGKGRMADIDTVVDAINMILRRERDMAGKRVVITAGGTREPIDPVRFIGNRSSGKMGHALAEAARDRGADVTLISTVSLSQPSNMRVVHVESASQMLEAVMQTVWQADVLVMAAAVADYRPKTTQENKIKKDAAVLNIELERTLDILAEVEGDFLRIGFAAETENLLDNARKKLVDKRLDLIAANDVTIAGSGFGSDTNKVTLISRDGKEYDLPLMPKRDVADKVWDWVAANTRRAA
ncbi:MAG: bifunctional phosphopantothenoylcysteine decarboxylase/phosphopantothenate--cysteine ligase CoaBC [Dehalococcoidia bacterium]|nr:bifunctional phosphopantothenoylcysteine decarboxylase/phosphopantothenate--cysteine ligase CoaBC [Dehalococcoidia bacterium]